MTDRELAIKALDAAYHALVDAETYDYRVRAAADAVQSVILLVCPDADEYAEVTGR